MTEASGEAKVMPALFRHCLLTYEAMLADATMIREGDIEMCVWQGFLTRLVKEDLKLSTPYYTYCRRALIEMGCIKQLRRGGSSSESQWELVKQPTEDDFMEYHETTKVPTASEVRTDAVDQSIRDMQRRIERPTVAHGSESIRGVRPQ
jgi:hypothetical protein